ncbi:MAG: hypothetical protein LBR93_06355 [Treponema sp.]|jgi:hypothetical protein|nr:hypothetical protein [Treponema sp.]
MPYYRLVDSQAVVKIHRPPPPPYIYQFSKNYRLKACTHIPAPARPGLNGAWAAAYRAFLGGPHTKMDTKAKKDAAKAVIRPFVNQYLRFPPVTNEDRTAMGVPGGIPLTWYLTRISGGSGCTLWPAGRTGR